MKGSCAGMKIFVLQVVDEICCVQVEYLVRCNASRYQAELMRILRHKVETAGTTSGGKSTVHVANSVMELRNICNHPCIR